MNKKVNNNTIFRCKICDKYYASASSLCNHNVRMHSESRSENGLIRSEKGLMRSDKCMNNSGLNTTYKKYTCRFCNKEYTNKQSRWSHEQKCKVNTVTKKNNNVDELKNMIVTLQKQIEGIVKTKGRVHHKTLEKINNQVSNTMNNNANNIVNGNVNINNTFVKFGNVCYEKIFSEKQLLSILNKQYLSLEEGISKTHFNEKLPEYSNVFITNTKDRLAYIFNGKAFITVKKHIMMNDLIDTHIHEINLTYEKMKGKLNPTHADRIEKFLKKLNDTDTKYTDPDNNHVYPNYKAYKMDGIELAIYNESDKKKLEMLKNIKLYEKLDSDSESDIEV